MVHLKPYFRKEEGVHFAERSILRSSDLPMISEISMKGTNWQGTPLLGGKV